MPPPVNGIKITISSFVCFLLDDKIKTNCRSCLSKKDKSRNETKEKEQNEAVDSQENHCPSSYQTKYRIMIFLFPHKNILQYNCLGQYIILNIIRCGVRRRIFIGACARNWFLLKSPNN